MLYLCAGNTRIARHVLIAFFKTKMNISSNFTEMQHELTYANPSQLKKPIKIRT